jgi:nitrite reductase/ring-hydroxylating ferredoxin subunit
VRGREVAIVKWNGEIYAVAARCPHMNALLSAGMVGPLLAGGCKVGDISVDSEVPLLACPWHGWQFDLRTGILRWDSTCRIRTYGTACEDQRVKVSISQV